MSDRKTFEYGGYHFTPIRKFQKKEGDFFAISKRLASDPNLGLCTYQGRQKVPYDYKGFYAISTDKECDVFRWSGNGGRGTESKKRMESRCFLNGDYQR